MTHLYDGMYVRVHVDGPMGVTSSFCCGSGLFWTPIRLLSLARKLYVYLGKA